MDGGWMEGEWEDGGRMMGACCKDGGKVDERMNERM